MPKFNPEAKQAVEIMNPATNADMIKTLYAESRSMQDFIGDIRAIDDVTLVNNVGDAVLQNTTHRNTFISALNDVIIYDVVASRIWYNSLSELRKEGRRFGYGEREIFVEAARPYLYDQQIAEDDVFKRELPDVSVAFHRVNRPIRYKATLSIEDLATAFADQYGLYNLSKGIIDSLTKGNEQAEYLRVKDVLSLNKPYIYKVHVDPVTTSETGQSLLVAMRTYHNLMRFPTTAYKYNRYGVSSFAEPSEVVILLRADIEAYTTVVNLANTFHMSEASIRGRIHVVDDFGPGNEDVIALVTTLEFFKFYRTRENWGAIWNPQGTYVNYNYIVGGIWSVSPFMPAVMFTTAAVVAPTGVSFDAPPTEIVKGDSIQLSAVVNPTGAFNGLAYSIVTDRDNLKSGTTLTSTGLLTVNEHETSPSIVIKAESVEDSTKSANITINIVDTPTVP